MARNIIAIKNMSLVIKQIREEKGITQEDFLFDCGIHIGRIEMGNTDMSCSTLIAVCDKLCISPADFFHELAKMTVQN